MRVITMGALIAQRSDLRSDATRCLALGHTRMVKLRELNMLTKTLFEDCKFDMKRLSP